MKKIISILSFSVLLLVLAIVPSYAATCNPTGFFRDGINMTAAYINPSSLPSVVDATGCNIGVYFDQNGSVEDTEVYGSNYFGVLVNGDANDIVVDVKDSNIHNVGEVPFNGTQHGVAIYYRSFDLGGSVSGKVSGNIVSSYQKGGITANGNVAIDVINNTVTGNGIVNYIAQNGIQFGWGAKGQITNNAVSDHSYSGANFASDGGILLVGGPCYGSTGAYTSNVQIIKNILTNNDVGIYLSNLQADCVNAPEVQTNNKVVNNTLINNNVSNTTGFGSRGYQAGIADQGNNDKLINNKISGDGYSPADTLTIYKTWIDADASFTNNAKVHANKFE